MSNSKFLCDNADAFVLYKKSLGYVYDTQKHYLLQYVKYAEIVSEQSAFPDKHTVNAFLDTCSVSPVKLNGCITVLREFSRYLHAQGFLEAYIVPDKRGPKTNHKPPYFFTESEINAVFRECDKINAHDTYPGREIALPAMFRLMYCCGLRCKETTSVLRNDVNTHEKYVDIIQSKGQKSRRLFISDELADYLQDYDTDISPIFPDRKYFFPHKNDTCYQASVLNRNFRKFWNNSFPDFTGTIVPNVYAFRHHFAYYNLNMWAKEGMDVNVMLPYLMRYMGHNSIKSSLYYFHFVPEFFPTYQEMSSFTDDVIPEVLCEN